MTDEENQCASMYKVGKDGDNALNSISHAYSNEHPKRRRDEHTPEQREREIKFCLRI